MRRRAVFGARPRSAVLLPSLFLASVQELPEKYKCHDNGGSFEIHTTMRFPFERFRKDAGEKVAMTL